MNTSAVARTIIRTMSRSFNNVTHVIFDMDGLLLDTEKLYTQSAQMILDEFGNGQKYTHEVKLTLMGFQTRDMSQRMVELFNLPITWEEYASKHREINLKLMRNAELMPDTEPIYEEITKQIAAKYDKPYPFEVRIKLLGTTEQRSAEIAVNDIPLPITVDEYLAQYNKLSREMLSESELMKGAKRLLCHLHHNNIPFALATSSGSEMVDIKTTNHRELFKLFHHCVCGSTDPEVKQGKPAPDIFLIAASRFHDKPNPSQCLVFEDSPNGIQAACTAGMQSVMVPDPSTPAEMRTKATLVLNSLEEFKPEDFGLPPFPECNNSS